MFVLLVWTKWSVEKAADFSQYESASDCLETLVSEMHDQLCVDGDIRLHRTHSLLCYTKTENITRNTNSKTVHKTAKPKTMPLPKNELLVDWATSKFYYDWVITFLVMFL